ncbi:hypothetical protein WG907_14670, partial [Sphingobium sp. AN558]|uniref:pirin family protein n=1 Tax=Sphingobium sp. AN558 TaxID=3133442 RepID=UPI0030C23DB1
WGARPLPKGDRTGHFVTLASGYENDNDALPVRTDARIVVATLKAGESAEYPIGKDRKAYIVPPTGVIRIDDVQVNARDGAAIKNVDVIRVTGADHRAANAIDHLADEIPVSVHGNRLAATSDPKNDNPDVVAV